MKSTKRKYLKEKPKCFLKSWNKAIESQSKQVSMVLFEELHIEKTTKKDHTYSITVKKKQSSHHKASYIMTIRGFFKKKLTNE